VNKYYSLETNKDKAVLNIYGDITSCPWVKSDVSAYNLTQELDEINADVIEVYINSYGGECAEGIAIYNALKRHKAKIKTYVDGFACSIASVVAMAGDERYMYPTSLLMIHNAWTMTAGNANDLRKEADTLETITESSIKAYESVANISREEIKALMDAETWLTANEALEKGFITDILAETANEKASQSVRKAVYQMAKYLNEAGTDGEILKKLDELSAKIDELCDKIATEKPTEAEDEPENEPEKDEETGNEPDNDGEEPAPENPETEEEETEDEEKDDTKGNNPFMNFLKTISK
jgi:ATP-dependent Clp protease protease subunit